MLSTRRALGASFAPVPQIGASVVITLSPLGVFTPLSPSTFPISLRNCLLSILPHSSAALRSSSGVDGRSPNTSARTDIWVIPFSPSAFSAFILSSWPKRPILASPFPTLTSHLALFRSPTRTASQRFTPEFIKVSPIRVPFVPIVKASPSI